MTTDLSPATLDGAVHATLDVAGGGLHHVRLGTTGSPVVLVHGFPESWWAFRRLAPLLARRHRVVALDLRGFGDSSVAPAGFGAAAAADDVVALLEHLDLGPVHLLGQDLSGQVVHRVAATRPELVRSLVAVETALPGFGAEALADVAHGGAWYIGALVADRVADVLLRGREEAFLADLLYPSYGVTQAVLPAADRAELVRGYARDGGFAGAAGLYRSLLHDGDEVRRLAARPLPQPVLAVGSAGGSFTETTMRAVAERVSAVQVDGAGHFLAQEAPERLAEVVEAFLATLE
jgi:pimeloyl-ACP methyl ester carboxylesterase